jgi:hypothetical protein
VAYAGRWYYATDVPKKRLLPEANEKAKPPSKWSAFAPRDSKALETAFQRIIVNPLEKVPPILVNEDHLFEVDVYARELKPVYFRGSTYEVLSFHSRSVLTGSGTTRDVVLSGGIGVEALR